MWHISSDTSLRCTTCFSVLKQAGPRGIPQTPAQEGLQLSLLPTSEISVLSRKYDHAVSAEFYTLSILVVNVSVLGVFSCCRTSYRAQLYAADAAGGGFFSEYLCGDIFAGSVVESDVSARAGLYQAGCSGDDDAGDAGRAARIVAPHLFLPHRSCLGDRLSFNSFLLCSLLLHFMAAQVWVLFLKGEVECFIPSSSAAQAAAAAAAAQSLGGSLGSAASAALGGSGQRDPWAASLSLAPDLSNASPILSSLVAASASEVSRTKWAAYVAALPMDRQLLLFDLPPVLGIALITRRTHTAPLASFARYQADGQVGGVEERVASSSAPKSISSWTHLWDAWVGYEGRMAGVFGPSVATLFAKTRDRRCSGGAAVGSGPPAFSETGSFPQAFATLTINSCTSLAAAKARRQGGQFATPRLVSGFERSSQRARRDLPTGQRDLLPRDVFDSVISKRLCAAFNRGSCGALGADGQPVAPNAAITVSQAAAPAQPAAAPAAPIAGRAVGCHRAIISSPPPIVSSRPLISSPASRLLFPWAVPFVGFSFWPGRAPSHCLLELPSRRCGIRLSSLQRLCFSQWRAGRSSDSDHRSLASVSDECRSIFLSILPKQDRLAFLSLARLAPDIMRTEVAIVSSELVSSFGLLWSGEPV
eukprot:g23926.t1